MRRAWRSLRVQLAVLGFLAIYVPVLLLFGVTSATENESVVTRNGETVSSSTPDAAPWPAWTVAALCPIAVAVSWWLAGRAVRPIEHVRSVAEEIEASDLSRRIGLDHGPTEVRSLAASFDGMLERLEYAADAQRVMVEDASHELRTPLAVLATNADVLLAHPDPSVDLYREGLERSRSVAARLRTTIDGMLVDARGRARTLDRQPTDVMTIAHAVADDARVLAEAAGVAITVDGPARLDCSADGPTVRRALSNLVDNAIRYAPTCTPVCIGVSATKDEAVLTVTDHGPGIPAVEQDSVFERYRRGRTDSPGTGLGLAVARQVALAHGGTLTLRSPGPSGDGCVFRLSLRR